MQELDEGALPEKMAGMLTRYAEVLDMEARLREEKKGLRDQLYLAMRELGAEGIRTQVGSQGFKVSRREKVEVVYDEAVLAARLGDRYQEILAVDLKKVRKHLSEVEGLLAPKLEVIGTPDREKVRTALEAGTVRVEEFTGAFEKVVKPIIYVTRAKDPTDDE